MNCAGGRSMLLAYFRSLSSGVTLALVLLSGCGEAGEEEMLPNLGSQPSGYIRTKDRCSNYSIGGSTSPSSYRWKIETSEDTNFIFFSGGISRPGGHQSWGVAYDLLPLSDGTWSILIGEDKIGELACTSPDEDAQCMSKGVRFQANVKQSSIETGECIPPD